MESEILQNFTPAQCRSFAMDEGTKDSTLAKLGIAVDKKAIKSYINAYDAALPDTITTGSVPTPVQFLQVFNPEIVEVATVPTDADAIFGRQTIGSWADEEIIQTVVEHTGQALPYGDTANPDLASWNANFEARTIVRFEEAMEVGALEEVRAAKMRLNSAKEKRAAAATSLDIERNLVAYHGYAGGANKTYGALTDPHLPAYVTVAAGAPASQESGAVGSTEWADKTYLEIQADILSMIAGLQTQSKGLYNPKLHKATLVVSLACEQYLNKSAEYGNTVAKWLKENYPNIEVKSSYFLDGANGGDNVAYLIADTLNGTKTIAHFVPEVFRMLGVFNKGKSYIEYFSNATAGIMVRQPLGVYRVSGI